MGALNAKKLDFSLGNPPQPEGNEADKKEEGQRKRLRTKKNRVVDSEPARIIKLGDGTLPGAAKAEKPKSEEESVLEKYGDDEVVVDALSGGMNLSALSEEDAKVLQQAYISNMRQPKDSVALTEEKVDKVPPSESNEPPAPEAAASSSEEKLRDLGPAPWGGMVHARAARKFEKQVMAEREEKRKQQEAERTVRAQAAEQSPNTNGEHPAPETFEPASAAEAASQVPEAQLEIEPEIETVTGLDVAENMPGEEEALRKELDTSMERLKRTQEIYYQTRKDYGVLTQLSSRFGIRGDKGKAYEEAQLFMKAVELSEQAYAMDLRKYLGHFKQQGLNELNNPENKAKIKSKTERQRHLKLFLATREVVPMKKFVDGKEQEVHVSAHEFFTAQQRELVENKKSALDESGRKLHQKLKDTLCRGFSKVWQEKLASLKSADTVEADAISALEKDGLGALKGSMQKYRSKMESQKEEYELVSRPLQVGEKLYDVLVKETGLDDRAVLMMLHDFKQEMINNLCQQGNVDWQKVKHHAKEAVPDLFKIKRGKRKTTVESSPGAITKADSEAYFRWRLGHLRKGETIRIVRAGGKMKIKYPSFNNYYRDRAYQDNKGISNAEVY